MLHAFVTICLATAQLPGAAPPQALPHIALTGGLFISAAVLGVVKPSIIGEQPQCVLTATGTCSINNLTALDSWSVQHTNAHWRRVSDVGEIVGIAAPAATLLALAFAAPAGHTAPAWDLLIWTETMAVGAFANQALKLTLRRPRPVWYRQVAHGADAQVSFPSGHAMATATAHSALTTLFWGRYPASPWRWAVLGAGLVVPSLTGVGRVEGGKHFMTDVVGGWLLGATLGFVQPTLMQYGLRMGIEPMDAVGSHAVDMVTLKGQF